MVKKTELEKQPSSFWRNTEQLPNCGSLNKDMKVDVVVAGGGMTGITTAYLLAKEGKKVALVEARKLAGGTTGYTTSKLTAQHSLIYSELIERYGKDTAEAYYQANMQGLAIVKKLTEEEDIDCDLAESDAYVFTQSDDWVAMLKKEADAYKQLSIDGEYIEESPKQLQAKAALVMHGQAQFHPIKYLHGLVKSIKKNGGKIVENTAVTDLEDGETIRCQTNQNHTITCNQVIFTTHSPTYEPDRFYSKNITPESSYALAIKTKAKLDRGMYINVESPKRTIRTMTDQDKDYILVGGESHPTGDGISSQERYQELLKYAEEIFGVEKIVSHWSSHDLYTPDRIPFIGQMFYDKKNIYTATGYGKWGLANATIGAELLKDLIMGKDNPYESLFSPQRRINELNAGDSEEDSEGKSEASLKSDPDNLKYDEGAVVQLNGKKVGAYRDTRGELHVVDITCTHLGCELAWNDGDRTWDCPCHGSRFKGTGEVVEGPAIEPLDTFQNK